MTTDDLDRPEGVARPPENEDDSDIPLGQRLFDKPFLLLIACMVVMFVFFTGWGMWEIMSLPTATLP